MKKILSILIVTLILAGCVAIDNQMVSSGNESTTINNYSTNSEAGGEDEMENNNVRETNDTELIRIIEQMLTDDDLIDAARQSGMTVEAYRNRLKRRLEFLQDEERVDDGWSERRKNTVDYVTDGFHIPAANDKDWWEIERFVFTHSISPDGHDGYGFVLDRMFGRVYYSPHFPGVRRLDTSDIYSTEFIEQDLENLINALEESSIRNWERYVAGEDTDEDFGSSYGGWRIGILFSDGTIRRWRGWGMPDEDFADGQFLILRDYIKAAGEDIIRRHEAVRQ